MEKSLEFLTKLKQARDFDGNLEYSLDEAIAELEEAMKPKTCYGCVYEDKDDGFLKVECVFCLRNSNDNFEPKEQ